MLRRMRDNMEIKHENYKQRDKKRNTGNKTNNPMPYSKVLEKTKITKV